MDSGEERPLKKGMARLIEKGHDDVAFSLMMRLGKNSSAGKDFLEQVFFESGKILNFPPKNSKFVPF